MSDATTHFVLDQADDGEWLVWDKEEGMKHRMGHDKQRVTELLARLNSAHRPNVERVADDGLRVCWNDHDKGQPCEYERIPRVPPNTRNQRPA